MLNNKEDIEHWLDENNVTEYSIEENLVVNVNTHLDLSNKCLEELPVKFGIIKGDVDISFNYLRTLENVAIEIHGDLFIIENSLNSLLGCPKIIKGNIVCNYNPLKTINLDELPTELGKKISIAHVEKKEQLNIFKDFYGRSNEVGNNEVIFTLQEIKSILLKNNLSNDLSNQFNEKQSTKQNQKFRKI